MQVGDLVANEYGDHFLVVKRYKIHNYSGPNKWSDTIYCQSIKTGILVSLNINKLEVINAASR